jgi:protein-glutamine gamma-glutamyltransferase
MNVPPLFIGLTLLFWGWEVKLLPLAAACALIVELPRFIRWRVDFSEVDIRRVWDLCEVLFLGAMVYAYVTTDIAGGPAKFMPWLPLIFFPFVAATVFSAHDRVRLSTYFWLLRKPGREALSTKPLGVFVLYWYFAACFIAASIMNARDVRFYAGVVLFGGWLLWMVRNRTAPAPGWILVTAIAVGAGFLGQIGLTRLQALVENKASQLFQNLDSPDVEFTQTRTAIGSVGKLKLSGRIVMRVETDGSHPLPALLRKASFSSYQSSGDRATWFAPKAEFGSVFPGADVTDWPLATSRNAASVVKISMFLERGIGILPVPNGPIMLEELVASSVQTNPCGSIRVRDGLPLVRYAVKYRDDASTIDAPPTTADLEIPSPEAPAVVQIATEIGLASQSPAVVLQRVERFFQEKFTYSRYLKGVDYDPTGRNTALRQFLLRDRAGHCEYFATAATLLLRQGGVPARYAIGFAVPEAERGGSVHLVRARHAHAWALAYVNGAWKDFDATPPSWDEVEEKQKAVYQPLTDLLSWLRYAFASWRYYGDRGAIGKLLLWLAPILIVWFLWRFFSRKRGVRLEGRRRQEPKPHYAGLDSEFYLVERQVAKTGVPRRGGEPLLEWADRVESARQHGTSIAPLHDIIALHYAYRFDPQGITARQRHELRSRVDAWLENALLPRRL